MSSPGEFKLSAQRVVMLHLHREACADPSQLLIIWLYSFLNKESKETNFPEDSVLFALKEKKKAQTNVVMAIVCSGKY